MKMRFFSGFYISRFAYRADFFTAAYFLTDLNGYSLVKITVTGNYTVSMIDSNNYSPKRIVINCRNCSGSCGSYCVAERSGNIYSVMSLPCARSLLLNKLSSAEFIQDLSLNRHNQLFFFRLSSFL